MPLESIEDILAHDIADLLSAEKQFAKALLQTARSAASDAVRQMAEEHHEQTLQHTENLKAALRVMERKAQSVLCKGAQGIVDENSSTLKEEKPKGAFKDLMLLAGNLRVEHYEIAAYTAAIAAARATGQTAVAKLLRTNLREEEATAKKLQAAAGEMLNQQVAAKASAAGRVTAASAPQAQPASGEKRRPGRPPAAAKAAAPASRPSSGGATAGRPKSGGAGRDSAAHPDEAGAQTTTDHDAIRAWVEARGGHPACVRGTGTGNDPGVLRIDFPGFSGDDSLKEISWEQFFLNFDKNNLAFLHQDKTRNGRQSRFSKLVSRNSL